MPFTFWGDFCIPGEIAAPVRDRSPRTPLELGCGVGRFSRYVAGLGVRATGVDFSPVAVEKARARAAGLPLQFLVGDVTALDQAAGSFDVSFDVGCFHCLDAAAQRRYAAEIFRLLEPGGTHLIWAFDGAPCGMLLSLAAMKTTFAPGFALRDARTSRRRLVRSHWYWLARANG